MSTLDKKSVDSLVAMIANRPPNDAWTAAHALRHRFPNPTTVLPLSQHHLHTVRAAAWYVLSASQLSPKVPPILEQSLQDQYEPARYFACDTASLYLSTNPTLAPALQRLALEDEFWPVRHKASLVLGQQNGRYDRTLQQVAFNEKELDFLSRDAFSLMLPGHFS